MELGKILFVRTLTQDPKNYVRSNESIHSIVSNGYQETAAASNAAFQKENGSVIAEAEATAKQEGDENRATSSYEGEFHADVLWKAGNPNSECDKPISVIHSNENGCSEIEADAAENLDKDKRVVGMNIKTETP